VAAEGCSGVGKEDGRRLAEVAKIVGATVSSWQSVDRLKLLRIVRPCLWISLTTYSTTISVISGGLAEVWQTVARPASVKVKGSPSLLWVI
jgi:hypothetical protein